MREPAVCLNEARRMNEAVLLPSKLYRQQHDAIRERHVGLLNEADLRDPPTSGEQFV